MAEADRSKALDNALAQIERSHGKGAVMRLGDQGRVPIEVIPTGAISLDIALGIGGLPRGRVVEIYGPESSGKTTVALHAVASAQRAGGIAAFIDAEHALDPEYAQKLGVDTDALLVSQPDSGEQALEIADMLIRSGALDIIAIDSVAALVPRAEIEGEMGDAHVGLQARLMSQALRKLTGALSNSGTTMIFINQLREKIGVMFGSPETTTGGKALKFYASVRLDVRRIESLKDGTDFVGNRTRIKVVKNKCLAEGTRVFDPTTGVTHRIEDVVASHTPVNVAATDKNGIFHVRPVVSWFDQGEQDVIGLRVKGGAEIWVTPDHKVMTDHGWRPAGELAVGDRVARPRKFQGFGGSQPIPPEQGVWGHLAPTKSVPSEFFAPDVCAEVVANLLFGLFESDGWVSREQTGALRVGYSTTSEQLAQQVHWLMLRWGLGSTVTRRDRHAQRGGLIRGRRVQGELPCWEVRVSGVDNVKAFAEAIPMCGPRGLVLTAALADAKGRHRGSQRGYLAPTMTEPVLVHLRDRGVTPLLLTQLLGMDEAKAGGGLRKVLGGRRLRRDRVLALAGALDDTFLHEILADELSYLTVTKVLPSRRARTFDVEVDELHNLVAEDIVVHNCAPPFKQAEFDIMYGQGISREGGLIDVGVETGLVRKAGAWYTYEGDQLGQGKENARTFMCDNPDLANELEKRILEKLGIGASLDDEVAEPTDIDF